MYKKVKESNQKKYVVSNIIYRRLRKFRFLLAYKYYIKFYYGERIRDYPLSVGFRMLLSRLAFLSQIPLLLPDAHFLVRYHGARMYIDLFAAPVTMDLALGVYEYWMTKLFNELVEEGMTVVDIGAHKGSYSLLFARLMNNRGRVLAFEPDPANCHWLRKSIMANDYNCVEVFQIALSDVEGNVNFHMADGLGSMFHNPWARILSKEATVVQARTLDNVLKEENIKDVHIIKMDVEGADLLVLKGAEETLKSSNISLIMDVDVQSNTDRKELFNFLTSCGFELYRIGKHLSPIKTASDLFLHFESGDVHSARDCRPARSIYARKS